MTDHLTWPDVAALAVAGIVALPIALAFAASIVGLEIKWNRKP